MEGHYESKYVADNTSSVGASATNSDGSFSAEGSLFNNNSISGNGGYKAPGPYAWYVDGHVYSGDYQGVGTYCVANYLIEVTSDVGDAWQGTRPAPVNPHGNCHNDPNGLATVMGPGGFYQADASQAHSYDGSFTWFGFAFSVSNGFTHDIRLTWDNNGTDTTYVCGDVNPVQDSGIFWNDNN